MLHSVFCTITDPHTSAPNSVCIPPYIPSEDKETNNEEEISLTNFEDGDSGSIDFGSESDTVDGENPERNNEANDSTTFHNLVETMEPSLLWQVRKAMYVPAFFTISPFLKQKV